MLSRPYESKPAKLEWVEFLFGRHRRWLPFLARERKQQNVYPYNSIKRGWDAEPLPLAA